MRKIDAGRFDECNMFLCERGNDFVMFYVNVLLMLFYFERILIDEVVVHYTLYSLIA